MINRYTIKKQSSRIFGNSVFVGRKINNPAIKTLYFIVIAVLSAVLYYSGIGCIWMYFLHIPCPGCGITRACVAFFSGDLKAALSYNYMFLSLPIIFVYVLFDGRFFKSKIIDYSILTCIAAGFFIHWLTQLA